MLDSILNRFANKDNLFCVICTVLVLRVSWTGKHAACLRLSRAPNLSPCLAKTNPAAMRSATCFDFASR